MVNSDLTAERIALNDATFREANERIRVAAEEHDVTTPIPFVCECADEACRTLVTLTLDEYAEVRDHPRRFFNAPGHEVVLGRHGRVIEERDGYALVEKIGRAGEVAAETAREHGGARA